ncbi:zinc metallochaperone AztD [Georgenia sp. Z1344]|uniref:zinc metallochaperone AztD n=1 Tax=Georgenia sp. Z1344 TaxID=3416706 RepID=UPI003CEB2BD8
MNTTTAPRRRRAFTALAVLPLALLAGCSGAAESGEDDAPATDQAGEESTSGDTAATDGETSSDDETPADDGHDHGEEEAGAATEAAAATPRIALTYDGGIQVLDATTLEVVEDIELPGFNRLNPAGDGRHLYVSTTGGFQLLDAGAWAEPHGDHSHYYTAPPALTETLVEADMPGHVVPHEGRTALFDDATGQVVVLDSSAVDDPDAETRDHTTPTAHHGVAIELTDGSLVISEGTEDARTGIRVLDGSGEEIAASDECPGVHGEATAADEVVVIGCEDGALVYSGGEITHVDSPDDYGRIGNQAGSDASAIVLGDYKTDPDAELERPERVSLIDTTTNELTLVDLPSSYSFRSLARGDDGEALVLGTDGNLHVIDPETGAITASHPVVGPWEEPVEWQEPRPALWVHDGTAYVTEPATSSIHAVDILTGEVWNTAELEVEPNEVNGISGNVEAGSSEYGGSEDGHDNDDEAESGDGHDHEHDHDDHDH